jgi:hypothetical protein
MGDSKAAGAWAIPTALPSSPTRVLSFRDGTRWASKLKTPAREIPSPTGESYSPNSAILLDASLTERVALGFGKKRERSRRISPSCRSYCGSPELFLCVCVADNGAQKEAPTKCQGLGRGFR